MLKVNSNMQRNIITHPGYNPKEIVYGFVGKKFKLSNYYYRISDATAQENIRKILSSIGKENHKMSMLDQVHGSKCVIIDDQSPLYSEGDGHVTSNNRIMLGIKTADCIPILFADTTNKIVGAAHSGWRGSIGGIIESTMEKMKKLGAKEECVDVIIGPSIHQNSYEVSEDFLQKFNQDTKENMMFFKPSSRQGHYMFDLPGYAKSRLKQYKFKNVFDIKIDTLKDEENWFSYRRSTLRNEPLDGQIFSFVGIN